MSTVMPVIFFGHGNPMNALNRNPYTESWAKLGGEIPKPKAIVCVSAHWYKTGTSVTAQKSPRTIHDFGGFPRALHEVRYPAPGDPALAMRVQELLAPVPVEMDLDWGLDHGTWSVLCHAYPKADIPVIQISIDETQPPGFHYQLGRKLAPLREEGVLIMGSGNIVHNLHAYAWGKHPFEPYDWAVRFEEQVRGFLVQGHHEPLIAYESLGEDALLSVPTPEHYLPLLWTIALQKPEETFSFPVSGVDGGSVSMLSVKIG